VIDRRCLLKTLTGTGLLAGTALGTGLLELLALPASGAAVTDIEAGQTAASLENLAVAVYSQTAALPVMKTFPRAFEGLFIAFITQTIGQHTEHGRAFNEAVKALGGLEQTGVDQAVFNGVVQPALPNLRSALDVVKLAAEVELVAAETYAALTAVVTDKVLRSTFASIAGVESQHRAVLLTIANLLESRATALLTIPTQPLALPGASGSAGFPDSFLPADAARPGAEGALR
jgi:ferritin-like protein